MPIHGRAHGGRTSHASRPAQNAAAAAGSAHAFIPCTGRICLERRRADAGHVDQVDRRTRTARSAVRYSMMAAASHRSDAGQRLQLGLVGGVDVDERGPAGRRRSPAGPGRRSPRSPPSAPGSASPSVERRREVQRREVGPFARAAGPVDRVDDPIARRELVHAGLAHPAGDVDDDRGGLADATRSARRPATPTGRHAASTPAPATRRSIGLGSERDVPEPGAARASRPPRPRVPRARPATRSPAVP